MRARCARILTFAILVVLAASGCSLLAPERVPDPIPAPAVTGAPLLSTTRAQPTPCPEPTGVPIPRTTAEPAVGPLAVPTDGPTSMPGPQEDERESQAILGEQVTVTFWHHENPNSLQGKLLSSMIQGFENTYPEISVQAVYVGDGAEAFQTVMQAVNTGESPDCAEASASQIARWIASDAVVPLDPFLSDPELGLSSEDLDDVFPGFLAACRYHQYGDAYYAFPFAHHALGLWYNMDLLVAAGYDRLPETWEEFERMCMDVSEQTGRPAYVYDATAGLFEACLISRGGSVLASDLSTSAVASPAAAESLAMLLRLCTAGAARSLGPEESIATAFGSGEVAFVIGSTSLALDLERILAAEGTVSEWGLTLLPQSESDAKRTLLYGDNLVIFNTSEINQRAAWLLHRYLTDSRQTAMWSMAGYLPVRRSAEEYLRSHFDRYPVARQQFEMIAPYAYPTGNVCCQSEISDYLQEAITDALECIQTPQDALARASDLIAGGLVARCP